MDLEFRVEGLESLWFRVWGIRSPLLLVTSNMESERGFGFRAHGLGYTELRPLAKTIIFAVS